MDLLYLSKHQLHPSVYSGRKLEVILGSTFSYPTFKAAGNTVCPPLKVFLESGYLSPLRTDCLRSEPPSPLTKSLSWTPGWTPGWHHCPACFNRLNLCKAHQAMLLFCSVFSSSSSYSSPGVHLEFQNVLQSYVDCTSVSTLTSFLTSPSSSLHALALPLCCSLGPPGQLCFRTLALALLRTAVGTWHSPRASEPPLEGAFSVRASPTPYCRAALPGPVSTFPFF